MEQRWPKCILADIAVEFRNDIAIFDELPKDGAFVEKIEEILGAAGMPSYRSVAPDDAEKIGHLYRARNSMHEGDIYFVDSSGVRRQVNNIQAEEFIAAAERFAIWIDALA